MSPIEFGGIRIDPRTFTGTKRGKKFSVTAREIELLRYFAAHAGEAVERFTLLDEIWGVRYEGTTRTLDQHIAKLRQKIEEDPAEPRVIRMVYGVGYRFLRDGKSPASVGPAKRNSNSNNPGFSEIRTVLTRPLKHAQMSS